MKYCEFCHIQFIPSKWDDGRQRFCSKLHQYKGWRKRNLERAREISKRTKDNHREEIRAAGRDYYKKNKDRMYENLKRWRAANKDRVVQQVLNRRYKVRGLMGSHTVEEWENIKKLHKYRCVTCHRRRKLYRDHIIPVTVLGSTNSINNIQPLCQQCNSSKSNHVDAVKV